MALKLLFVIWILPFCSTLNWTESPDLFQCPPKYGTCNTCIQMGEKIVALTRKVCGNEYGEYTQRKCLEIFGGITRDKNISPPYPTKGGLCGEDGCDWCTCFEKELEVLDVECPKYNYEVCMSERGRTWKCGESECTCTKWGIGFSH